MGGVSRMVSRHRDARGKAVCGPTTLVGSVHRRGGPWAALGSRNIIGVSGRAVARPFTSAQADAMHAARECPEGQREDPLPPGEGGAKRRVRGSGQWTMSKWNGAAILTSMVATTPVPVSRRRSRRLGHHLTLAAASAIALSAGLWFLEGDLRSRTSLALAWAAMAGFTATLSLGPLNLLRRRPNPVSSDLRRDLGIWTAILALAHTGVGLTVHFRGRMHLYFLAPPDQRLPGPLRLDLFGITNHLGLIAAILLLGLALISSDRWLARLGTSRWKRWQRIAYVAAALTVVHGLVFQFLEGRAVGLVAGLLLLSVLIAVAQILGVRVYRRRRGAVRES